MLLLNIVADGTCRKYSAVTTQDKVDQTLEQTLFANLIPPYQVIKYDGVVQIIQIPALRLQRVKLKPFGKSAPHKIIGYRHIFSKFFAIFDDFLINERSYPKRNISSG